MKYIGSKERISTGIVGVLQRLIYVNNIDTYIEPFVGGANIIDKVQCKNRYGYDIDPLVIALHKIAVETPEKFDTLPKELSKQEYYAIRDGEYDLWYKAQALFFGSYNSRAYGGCYGAQATTKDGKVRNYYNEALSNYKAQIPLLKGIHFDCADYREIEIPDGSLVYCDIPYKDTIGYVSKFDTNAFWEWARELSKRAIVVVSEYEAPDDFKCIWEANLKTHLNNRNKLDRTEKLFVWGEKCLIYLEGKNLPKKS